MVSVQILIGLVPLLPVLGFLILSLNVNRLSKGTASVVACGSVLLSFLISIYLFFELLNKPEDQRFIVASFFNWISAGNFSTSISFLVDPLSSLMLLIITGVGFLI